jgi:hypothetical protein
MRVLKHPAGRLLAGLALVDLIASSSVGFLRFKGDIEAGPFGVFVNVHLILLASLALVLLLRAGAGRGLLGLIAALLLGDLGFAYAEFSGQHHGTIATAAEILWAPVRIAIGLLALQWGRSETEAPERQQRWALVMALGVLPSGLILAVIPLLDAGNLLSALVAALGIPALIAISWAWPALPAQTKGGGHAGPSPASAST